MTERVEAEVRARSAPTIEARGASGWDRAKGPVATVVLSLLAMAQALRIWEWRPGDPLGLSGDAPWMATLIRGYVDDGPYADNPVFGAPFALNTGWSSTGNDLHVWILTALGTLTSNPFTVMAVYFMATFPLSALTMYWLCRRSGVARPAAVMAGVLFSVVPGHQERFPHLFLAAYWTVPFAAWLVIETARGRSVFGGRPDAAGSPRRARTLVPPVLMVLAIGLGDVYYVAFTLVLAVPIILLRQLRRFDARELARQLVPFGVVVLPTMISLAVARRRADRDVLTGALPFGRSFLDSDRWSGQIIDLVLPWAGHRVPSLATRTQAYDALTHTAGEVSAIGVVAVLGLCGLLCVTAAALLRGRTQQLDPLVAVLTVASLLAIAFFTRGALGSITALFVTPQIRTWSRLFLFIALFGLLAAGWFLTRLARSRGWRRGTVVTVSAALLVVGVLDQTNPDRAPAYAANRAALATVAGFDDAVRDSLGAGCSVFVLPVVGFPEVNDNLWPDLMTLGLASRDLRWSFGAIKGTEPADWQLGLGMTDADRLTKDLAAVGYCGIVVESSLAERSPQLEAALPQVLGQPVATSLDGRYAAYDLRGTRRTLLSTLGSTGVARRATAVLHPVVATLQGAWAVDEAAGRRYPLGPGSSIQLANMSDESTNLTLDIALLGPSTGAVTLTLGGQTAAPVTVRVGARGRTRAVVPVVVPPGGSSVDIAYAGKVPDWSAYSEPASLASVESVRVTPTDAQVNAGVDLPTP